MKINNKKRKRFVIKFWGCISIILTYFIFLAIFNGYDKNVVKALIGFFMLLCSLYVVINILSYVIAPIFFKERSIFEDEGISDLMEKDKNIKDDGNGM